MNKKSIKKQKHISMEKFLRCYVQPENEKLVMLFMELTHKEIKGVCEYITTINLTRIPFDVVTKEDIKMGKVLLVVDAEGNIAPYLNPKQNELDRIMIEEDKKSRRRTYGADNYVQAFEDYVDALDELALDKGTPNQKIKKLGSMKTIRKGGKNDKY